MRLTVMGTNPQTEAQAIVAEWLGDSRLDMYGTDELTSIIATALAAKDAELVFAEKRAKVRALDNEWLRERLRVAEAKLAAKDANIKMLGEQIERAERAEAQLAEANKALEPFAKAADNFDGFKIVNDEEWFAYGGVQSAAGSKGAIAVADLRAARRAREQGGE